MKPSDLIDELLLAKSLKEKQAEFLLANLFSSDTEIQKQILTLLAIKGESTEELVGLVRAIRKKEKPLKIKFKNLVDGCGTGADESNTFNISTIASFVTAGAGAHVAKHGNRGISSKFGSTDLIKALNIKIETHSNMIKSINHEKCRIGYFHAPLYHQSFKSTQEVRKELRNKYGIRTIFNIIGPIMNPFRPKRQVIGVFRKDLLEKIAESTKKLGFNHVLIVHSNDGLDELTTTDKTNVVELKNGKIKKYSISATKFGFKKGKKKNLTGGKPSLNKKIALDVLSGKDKTEKRDVVLLNAAAMLYVSGKAKNLKEGIKLARKSIDSGTALRSLKNLVKLSHGS